MVAAARNGFPVMHSTLNIKMKYTGSTYLTDTSLMVCLLHFRCDFPHHRGVRVLKAGAERYSVVFPFANPSLTIINTGFRDNSVLPSMLCDIPAPILRHLV